MKIDQQMKKGLPRQTNSYQYHRKFVQNSMENRHADIRA